MGDRKGPETAGKQCHSKRDTLIALRLQGELLARKCK